MMNIVMPPARGNSNPLEISAICFPWFADAPHRRIKTAAELLNGIELIELSERAKPKVWAALRKNLLFRFGRMQ
jgi:hypothetical protein